MTATSGPGISLMQEFIGLAYFAEIPSVFWDVCRVGHHWSTNKNPAIRHYLAIRGSHGDTQHIVLFPELLKCFEFGWRALITLKDSKPCIWNERFRSGYEPLGLLGTRIPY